MNKKKLPSIIPILVLTLITVIMWVSLDVLRAIRKPSSNIVPQEVSQPIDPKLDEETIKQIESRNFIDDSQIPDDVSISSPIPTTRATSTPTTTVKPLNTPIPEVTPDVTEITPEETLIP